jgi:hypothetical protein
MLGLLAMEVGERLSIPGVSGYVALRRVWGAH